MYQPLEQFIIPYSFVYTIPFSFINMIFVNKIIILFGIMFVCLFFLVHLVTYHIFRINTPFIRLISRLINEFINVSNHTFSILLILYLSLFFFLLILNLIGLFPYNICWTTQIFANLTLSFSLIMGLTLMNLDKNGIQFFSLFIPQNVPSFLIVPLFSSEFISYFIRILSLSIRLFSNMVAGHSLLHISFDMANNIHFTLENSLILFLFSSSVGILAISTIICFEFIVAFLQSYVFAIMFIIYSNDLALHH